MSDKPRVLAVIPARGGSSRLPKKNLRNLAGKPLIDWTVVAALDSGIPSKIVVSSDDDEILKVTERYPAVAPMKRSPELAMDTSTTNDVLLDVVDREEASGDSYDVVLLLQPTSPLRTASDIDQAFQLYNSGSGDSVVTVCEAEHPIAWCGTISASGYLYLPNFIESNRSQDYEPQYRLNGAIYVCKSEHLKQNKTILTKNVIASIMPQDRSLDIDTERDFRICQFFFQQRESEKTT